MNGRRETASEAKISIDYGYEESSLHANVFHGAKTGVIVSLIFFWIPLGAMCLLGWWFVIAYGVLLAAAAVVLGFLARQRDFRRSVLRRRPFGA